MDVVVQMPAFQEGDRLRRTANAIASQDTPEFADVDVEAWVTLSPPDRSLCTTWQAAMRADGIDVHEAPQGKLSARNAAHAAAVQREYDVIVTWDADAPPLNSGVLTALLSPFSNDAVVATNSNPISNIDGRITTRLYEFATHLEDRLSPHLHGQCSAFTTGVWDRVGPFDNAIDQSDIKAVRAEEEFDFYRRLAEQGEIVDVEAARVYNDTRRFRCRIGAGDPSFCQRRSSTTTFHPKE